MRPASSDGYDGIPYVELPIDAIDWTHAVEHIRQRSQRKGRPEFDVEPEWGTEAALDPYRVVRDSGSRSGESIAVTGYSPTADRVLTVILVPKSHPPTGEWWGASAWAANDQDRGEYERRKQLEELGD